MGRWDFNRVRNGKMSGIGNEEKIARSAEVGLEGLIVQWLMRIHLYAKVKDLL